MGISIYEPFSGSSGLGTATTISSTPSGALAPGYYEIDVASSITMDLASGAGTWIFLNSKNQLTDAVKATINGGTAKTFSIPNGSSVQGDFVMNRGQSEVIITNASGGNDYLVTVNNRRSDSKVTVKSNRIGEFVYKKTFGGALDAGYLAVIPGTVTNGAVLYPVWASLYPEFVSGANIVFPADVNGMFLRNVGGNAGTQGAFQAGKTAVNGLTVGGAGANPAVGNATAGNFGLIRVSTVGQSATSTATDANGSGTEPDLVTQPANHGHSLTGDNETAPINRAYQLYTIVDSYEQQALVPTNATVVSSYVSPSSTSVPNTQLIDNRFKRAIWARLTCVTAGNGPTYTDQASRTLTSARQFLVFNYANAVSTLSNAADWGTVDLTGNNPQYAITVAGTYEVNVQFGVRGSTVNTNYVVEVIRYNSANAVQEIIGYTDAQAATPETINKQACCFGIGNFSVGDKIGIVAYAAAGGPTLLTPTYTIKALSF